MSAEHRGVVVDRERIVRLGKWAGRVVTRNRPGQGIRRFAQPSRRSSVDGLDHQVYLSLSCAYFVSPGHCSEAHRASVSLTRFFARMRGFRRMDRKAEEETNGSAIRDVDNAASRRLGRVGG